MPYKVGLVVEKLVQKISILRFEIFSVICFDTNLSGFSFAYPNRRGKAILVQTFI